MQPLLTTTGLAVGYGSRVITENINVEMHNGDFIALLGANGMGKSTLLRTLSDTQQPLAGNIRLQGRELSAWTHRELSRMVGLVYTDRTLAGGLTVEELVALGRQPHTGFFGHLSRDDRHIVQESMRLTGIIGKRHCFVAQLSDGERQKTMIAKALAQSTPLIIMDEPTAFLDVASRLETIALLRELSRNHGKAILLSTHDISSAVALCDKLWLLNAAPPTSGAKSVLIEGTPAELTSSTPGLSTLFEGRDVHYDPLVGDYRPD